MEGNGFSSFHAAVEAALSPDESHQPHFRPHTLHTAHAANLLNHKIPWKKSKNERMTEKIAVGWEV